MSTWWVALTLTQQIFYIIAIVSSIVLMLQIILNLIGLAGGDLNMDGVPDALEVPHDIEFHLDGSHLDVGHLDGAHLDGGHLDSGLGLMSFRTILAFLVGFGWGGVVVSGADAVPWFSVLIATLTGGVFMLVVFWLMRMMFRLSDSGNIDIANAEGKTGTVYLPIPAQNTGSGQVQLMIQGRLREVPAITDEPQPLPTGTHVQIVQILDGNVMLVRRVVPAGTETKSKGDKA